MHNCKTTREWFTESLFNDSDAQPDELVGCPDCRDEFQSVRETLRITKRALNAVEPAEEYWVAYHSSLRQRLFAQGSKSSTAQPLRPGVHKPSLIMRVLSSSIRVPIPAAAALLFVFALSVLFAIKASQHAVLPPTVSVIHVPVEIPVIQNKVITKVVYRERRVITPALNQSETDATLAKSQKVNTLTLDGFKPLDEVKLTVIKGGSPDDK